MNSREAILSLLNGHRQAEVPAFSGLIHVTAQGLESEGLSWREVHHDARKMARAAASTFHLTGIPSATLPLDLCAPAEALGAELIFYGENEFQFPQVKRPLAESAKELAVETGLQRLPTLAPKSGDFGVRAPISNHGRMGIICEAIQLAQKDIGKEAVISGMIPGPYTLLLYLCNPKSLFIEMKKEPQSVFDALFHLSFFLSQIGRAYREAGADFITIHDMGGSPGFIGPGKYEQFALPAEKDLIEKLPAPRVLSVCGNTNASMRLLAQSGAEAISVDQTNDLAASRAALKDALLFGNLDPVATIWRGDSARVHEAAQRAKEAGVDAVWPGCDLVVQTPIANLRIMSNE